MKNINMKIMDLYKKSRYLRDKSMLINGNDQTEKVRQEQDKYYKEWLFWVKVREQMIKSEKKEKKMKQYEIILRAMLKNKNKRIWTAKDFQYEKNFVGYEASARMSELAKNYSDILIVGKEGRFRTLSVNWKNQDAINEILKQKGW